MPIALYFVGFGNVARRFISLLDESRDALAALDIPLPTVAGIATRRHGARFDVHGVDARAAVRDAAAGRPIGPPAPVTPDGLSAHLRQLRDLRPILIETTTLDVKTGEPATSHVRAGFAAGADVITANKGPVAFAARALSAEAAAAGVSFLFEGAVMDGIPIFNLVRETLPAVTVNGFRGVINSTTNHILTAMERSEPFDDALARMQAEGVAEADPSLDLDGWDAAAKTAALANVLLDADLAPGRVTRDVVDARCGERARAARAAGRRLKLVAQASGRGSDVSARVALQELPAGDPLTTLDGQGNAVELDTWPTGRIVVMQRDGGLEKTAYALLTDFVTVVRRRRA